MVEKGYFQNLENAYVLPTFVPSINYDINTSVVLLCSLYFKVT